MKNITTIESQLIEHSKLILDAYLNKENLIANYSSIFNYLYEYSKILNFFCINKDFDPSKNDSEMYNNEVKKLNKFLKKEIPLIVHTNNFPKQEIFKYIEKMEATTFHSCFDYSLYLDNLSMIKTCIKDAYSILEIGDDFKNFKFHLACSKMNQLDTLVRDYFSSDFWNWKHNFENLPYLEIKQFELFSEELYKKEIYYKKLNEEILLDDREYKTSLDLKNKI